MQEGTHTAPAEGDSPEDFSRNQVMVFYRKALDPHVSAPCKGRRRRDLFPPNLG